MKAIFFEQHGGPEILKYADLPDPKPKQGEALIRVRAVALNHLDIWVRNGWRGLKLDMPHITGSDIAGEIVQVNHENSQWVPGTKVIVNPGVTTSDDQWTRRGQHSISPGYKLIGEQLRGGMADYVTVPVANVFRMPDQLSFELAAAPLLVGVTCWRMLFQRAQIMPGETVLIVGAGGGVNSLCIQLARATGASVIALSSSAEKLQKAAEIGAHQGINYRTHPEWAVEVLKITKGRGADVVIDNVGAATFAQSLKAVSRGGRIVTVGNTSGHQITFDNRMLFTKQVTVLGSTMGSPQDFIDAMQFLWNNNIKPVVDRVESLKDGIRMLQYLEKGEQFGKIVLVP
jgi:NADPH:quinone reductase-like Zn-dependent oxidoreductase